MKVILDTNVFISGVFFSGPPAEILRAWQARKLKLVVSPEILDEYRRVGQRLEWSHPGIEVGPFLILIALHAEVVQAPELTDTLCEDPTDDMFFACAQAGNCRVIVSGDKHLHRASGFSGVEVLRPREFVRRHLAS